MSLTSYRAAPPCNKVSLGKGVTWGPFGRNQAFSPEFSRKILICCDFVTGATGFLDIPYILEGGSGNGGESFPGEEGLMARDHDIGEGGQAGEDIVLETQ